MSDLQLFLDRWLIYRSDGSYVLNGKYDDFYQELQDHITKSYKHITK